MRFLSGLVTCLSMGVSSLAYSDPPATPPVVNTPEPAAVTPAPPAVPAAATTTQAASAAPTAPAIDPREKYLLSKGYKIRMHKGVKMFCREEDLLGSRVEKVELCGTAQALLDREQEAKYEMERISHVQNMPKDTTVTRMPTGK